MNVAPKWCLLHVINIVQTAPTSKLHSLKIAAVEIRKLEHLHKCMFHVYCHSLTTVYLGRLVTLQSRGLHGCQMSLLHSLTLFYALKPNLHLCHIPENAQLSLSPFPNEKHRNLQSLSKSTRLDSAFV